MTDPITASLARKVAARMIADLGQGDLEQLAFTLGVDPRDLRDWALRVVNEGETKC